MAFKRTSDTTNNNSKNDRPDPSVWLNIGYTSVDEETGEETFVSLPLGIGLDTMKPRDITARMGEDFRQLLEGKNKLLEMLQRYVADFEPGQEEIIGDLQIQVRRVEETTPEVSEEGANTHLNNLSRLSFANNRKAA